MRDLDEVLATRRSVRGFVRDREVPEGMLREVLALAQHAPSNCNVQPWRVMIASGAARDRLALAMTKEMDAGNYGAPEDPIDAFPGEYRPLQIACGAELYGRMGVARDDYPARIAALRRNFELFDAPHVAIVAMEKFFGIGVALDVGTWLQSFLLALWSRGVGACPQAALRHYPEIVRRELGLRDDLRILCGVSFGYENPDDPANLTRQKREAVESNVTFVR